MKSPRPQHNIEASWIFSKLRECDKNIIVLEGGTRSSKTFCIIVLLIYKCITIKNHVVRSYRADQTVARKTLIPDFLEIMQTMFKEEWEENNFNKSEACYYFSNGSRYYFDGCEVSKLHGLKQDDAHLNEVMEITYDSWFEIIKRTPGIKILDFNPSKTRHWVFSNVLRRDPVEYLYLHSTYKDNPFLDQVQVAEIEGFEDTPENRRRGTADKRQWEIYGLGKRSRQKGLVFENWEITEDWPDRMACEKWGYGLDFGFSNPTALTEVALFQNELYLKEIIYERNLITSPAHDLSIPSIAGWLEFHKVSKKATIWADQAHPDQIRELQIQGYKIQGAPKSDKTSTDNYEKSCIDRLQQYKINVYISSQNLQGEFENYTYKVEKSTGVVLDEPIDDFNHAIKGVMYFCMMETRRRSMKKPIPDHLAPLNPFEPLYKSRSSPSKRYKPKLWELENPYVS